MSIGVEAQGVVETAALVVFQGNEEPKAEYIVRLRRINIVVE